MSFASVLSNSALRSLESRLLGIRRLSEKANAINAKKKLTDLPLQVFSAWANKLQTLTQALRKAVFSKIAEYLRLLLFLRSATTEMKILSQ